MSKEKNKRVDTGTITKWVLAKDELAPDESDVSIHQQGEPKEEPGDHREAGRPTVVCAPNSCDDSHDSLPESRRI